ncbi:MAG TPA: hypothetical protein VE035_06905 [Puia sp.]|nr:hypothetical protein [Puia sp.]
MNNKRIWQATGSLILAIVLLTGCGNGGVEPKGNSGDSITEKMGPPPGNDAANNPSSADTLYRKDSTRGPSDSLHE